MKEQIEAHANKSSEDIKTLNMIEVKLVELAAKGCREPGSPPLKCTLAKLTWGLDGVPEIAARLKAAGCPEQ